MTQPTFSLGIENLYTPDCIRTVTGKYVNVFDPKPEMFCIEDIAHALSMQPRFGGHLPVQFSVAEHSINCSFVADEFYKLTALMHDASEAYLLDIPRPIKQRLANYKEIEHGLMVVLSHVFGFQYPLPGEVKAIDEQMLRFEWNSMMISAETTVRPLPASIAKKVFIQQFEVYAK